MINVEAHHAIHVLLSEGKDNNYNYAINSAPNAAEPAEDKYTPTRQALLILPVLEIPAPFCSLSMATS